MKKAPDLAVGLGIICLIAGVVWVYIPAGLIVAGALLIGLGILVALNEHRR